VLLLLMFACKESSGKDGDTGPDSGTTDSGTRWTPAADCEALGLPQAAFVETTASTVTYDLAADFTMATTEGDWNLRENWSGCDTYLFVPSEPVQNQGAPDGTWALKRDNRDLLEMLPRNTHVFFVSSNRGTEADDEVAALVTDYDDILGDMDAEDAAWWDRHVHFATEGASGLGDYVGDLLQNPGTGFGIDRFQQIREIGSMADPARYDAAIGWFDPNVSFVANEAVRYDYEAERQAMLDSDGATVVHAWQGDVVSGVGYFDIQLPDAATMATFDTLVFDFSLFCEGAVESGYCPAWDYLTYAKLCDVDDPTVCTTEIGRWITTYWREGRWVHDVSALLPLFEDGGKRRISYETQQTYDVTFDLRFSNQGKAVKPEEMTYLWSGGTFDANWSTNHPPIDVFIPADAAKVEIATVISGHNGNAPDNCAEFCATDHHFLVNGVDHVRDISLGDEERGCMDQIANGTVPNQYGTWWYGRDGWCPGKQVDMVMLDVTDSVVPGETAHLEYEAYHNGEPYPGSATLVVETWLVVSR
jgi:hypothetical protein